MFARAHTGKTAPILPGRYYKFTLEMPPVDFLVPGPASRSNRAPFVLMHMRTKPEQTRVVVPEPATAVDDTHTPVDATAAGDLTAGSDQDEITQERPESPEEQVTGLIEHLTLTGGGGTAGAGEGGETLVESAAALKTEGNRHFSGGDYLRALTLYSEA